MGPFVAASAALVAFAQYRLARARRTDDLFDRRYRLFEDVLAYGRKGPDEDGTFDAAKFVSILARAEFLFDGTFRDSLRAVMRAERLSNWSTFENEPDVIHLFRDHMR